MKEEIDVGYLKSCSNCKWKGFRINNFGFVISNHNCNCKTYSNWQHDGLIDEERFKVEKRNL